MNELDIIRLKIAKLRGFVLFCAHGYMYLVAPSDYFNWGDSAWEQIEYPEMLPDKFNPSYVEACHDWARSWTGAGELLEEMFSYRNRPRLQVVAEKEWYCATDLNENEIYASTGPEAVAKCYLKWKGILEPCLTCNGSGAVEIGDDEGSHLEACPDCGGDA